MQSTRTPLLAFTCAAFLAIPALAAKPGDISEGAPLTVDDTQGESIEDYSRTVATDWGVGDDGRNNGVLVVADMGERELRIEVADGAREVLSDGDARNIMQDELEPGFKKEDYAGAFTNTITEVYDEANPQAAADREAKSNTLLRVILGLV